MSFPNFTALSASDGAGEPVRATVLAARIIGSTSISVNALTNWPTGTFIATTGTLLANGTLSPSTVQVFYGTASGTTITILSFASGYSDLGNAINDVVVIKPTTEWANTISDAFTNVIQPNAVASAANLVQVTNAIAGSSPTIAPIGTDANINLTLKGKGTGSVLLPAGSVTGTEIAGSTVTSSNILAGTITGADIASGTISGANIGSNTVTANNLVGVNMFGVGSPAFGTPPARLSGQFYIQAGQTAVALNASAGGIISFPDAFPNGVLTVLLGIGNNAVVCYADVIGAQVSTTAFGLQASSNVASDTIVFNWIAIGF